MRRFLTLVAILTLSTAAHAADSGTDADTDAATDAETDSATVADSGTDSGTDAATDAGKDASSADANTSDVCDPNIEPCTTRADTGTGDTETEDASTESGGCSCDAAGSNGLPSPLLLVALGLLVNRVTRKPRKRE